MGFFGGGGGSVDLASPSAIGSTTPNTGAFTTLSFAPANNTTGFSNTGNSLTGSNAQSLVSLEQTWNTTGTPTSINLNITDTASNAYSRFITLQRNGSAVFFIDKAGRMVLRDGGNEIFSITRFTGGGSSGTNGQTFINFSLGGSSEVGIKNNISGVVLRSAGALQWTSDTQTYYNVDTFIYRDAANIIAQRNSTNAQAFRLYNTFTDASNYERGFFRWNTNVLEIGAEAAGTGTKRVLRIVGQSLASAESVSALEVNQTWNTTGTPSAIILNITDTASNASSRFIDLRFSGTTVYSFGKGTFSITAPSGIASSLRINSTSTNPTGGTTGPNPVDVFNSSGSRTCFMRADGLIAGTNIGTLDDASVSLVDSNGEAANYPRGVNLNQSSILGWGGTNWWSAKDLILRRDAANILAQRNSTNAQTFRLYNTFTSDTNFERLNFRWASDEFILDAEKGSGGGTLRGIKIGSATTSLLGFYGVTPVDQPATVTDPTGGGTQDAEARTAINAIIDRLQELGLIA